MGRIQHKIPAFQQKNLSAVVNLQLSVQHIDNVIVHPPLAPEHQPVQPGGELNAAAVEKQIAAAFQIELVQPIAVIEFHGITSRL